MIRLAIVDDQSLLREGLKVILEKYEDIEVTALGECGKTAIEILRKYSIDVILMDIRMPNMNGVEAVKEIRRFNQEVKIIMLTTFDDEDYIVDAIGNGANGYIFKDIAYDQVIENIRGVFNGQYIMPSRVAQVLARKLINQEHSKDNLKSYNFTARELEMIDLIKDGFTNKQIARALYISEGTAKNYISSIYNKTGINSRDELIKFIKNTYC